ncbi:ABC transporter permease [Dactylosporangium sp. NPDC050688]|uniref:ABC transporter permease n=1 Tax=Dactylosporangium sp. NPDC050688 TaxID=3157217 RepID=UPI0033F98D74
MTTLDPPDSVAGGPVARVDAPVVVKRRRRRLPVLGIVGAVIVAVYVLVAVFAPLLAPHSPTEGFSDHILSPPGGDFPLGTDSNGMDVLSRVLYAARLDLVIAVAAVALSIVAGAVLGLIVGYRGGWLDTVIMRAADVFQAFPILVLALALLAAAQGSLASVILVIALVDTPVFLRLVRSETIQIKQKTYVEAAQSVGNPTWRLLVRHILPNAIPPVIVQSAVRLAWSVNIVASLAFVGVGIQVPTPEWGSMIKVGAQYVSTGEWWPYTVPGIAILVLTLGFNLLADGLQDHLDPRRRK